MGTTSKILHDIIEGIDDVLTFFVTVTLLTFIGGQFYGVAFNGRNEFWFPVWGLLIILVLKAMRDAMRPVTGAATKMDGGG